MRRLSFGSNSPLNGPGVSPGAVELLLARLHAERGGERREAQVERHQLHFDAAFMLLVGEGLAHAVARRIERIGKPELVVLVVGVAVPEAHGIDAVRLRAVLALAGDLRLARVDARLVVFAVDAGNTIERVVLRDRGADEALIEDVGRADRPAVRCARTNSAAVR